MKTPDEIKKGLVEAIEETAWVVEGGDAHDLQDVCDMAHASMADALAYIQQIEAERDAAVKDIVHTCATCKHYFYNKADGSDCEYDCMDGPEGCHNGNTRWEWCGVQKEKDRVS